MYEKDEGMDYSNEDTRNKNGQRNIIKKELT